MYSSICAASVSAMYISAVDMHEMYIYSMLTSRDLTLILNVCGLGFADSNFCPIFEKKKKNQKNKNSAAIKINQNICKKISNNSNQSRSLDFRCSQQICLTSRTLKICHCLGQEETWQKESASVPADTQQYKDSYLKLTLQVYESYFILIPSPASNLHDI